MADDPEDPKHGKPKRPRAKKPAKLPSPDVDVPYDVGKYKPPVEHRFEQGNKGGGRPKGAKNKNHLDGLLDEKVTIGHDSMGRPRRKTWRNVINLQLLKRAAEGDLAAIKLVIEFDLKVMALRARSGPAQTQENFREKAEKDKLSKQLADKYIDWLDWMAQMKKLGALASDDGKPVVAPWVLQAMREYRERHPDPDEPSQDGL